jgi:integration host factor subunit alpha
MELSFDTIETPTLTKAELADLLFEQLGLNKREAKEFIDAFFDLITADVAKGEDVKISGFGNFQVKTKQERPGRNPRTREPVIVKARRSVTFHASAKLKDAIQGAAKLGQS